MIIFHTKQGKEADLRAGLRASEGGFSAHYLVASDGKMWEMTPESRVSRHTNGGFWRGRTNLDASAIGIVLAHQGGGDIPVLQLAAACDLCLHILSRHPVPARNILAQSDILPATSDQTAIIDWEGMARNGVGLWPQGAPDLGTHNPVRDAASLRDVRAALAVIGYRVAPEGPLDPALSLVLRAFQRHWRPEAITGQADAGTLARLLAVARLCA